MSNSPGGQSAFAGQLRALAHGTARHLGEPQRRLGALLSVSTALLDLGLEKSPWRVSSTVHGSGLQPCLGSSPRGCVSTAAQVDSWQFALLFSPLKKLLCEQGTQQCFACLDSVYLVKKKKKSQITSKLFLQRFFSNTLWPAARGNWGCGLKAGTFFLPMTLL